MKRPTIKDLAQASGVSISTVNRILHGTGSVRRPTKERVLHAARQLGFDALGPLQDAVMESRDTYRLGVLLQQPGRPFYEGLGNALHLAAEAYTADSVHLTVEFLDDLAVDNVAARLRSMASHCDSIALVAAQHPILANTIDAVLDRGVAVCGLIAPLSANGNVGYIGLDHWKVGRTAAWAFNRLCPSPGKIGILVGNHRYRNQELNESGFRSYFREHNRGFSLLEPQSTYESSAIARDVTESLFAEYPDMRGLFISGGGITGALAAVREADRGEDFIVVGYELFDTTRAALIDGTLTLAISHPLTRLAEQTISTLIRARDLSQQAGAQREILNFDIYTSENV